MNQSIKEISVEIDEGSAVPVFARILAVHLGKSFYRILPPNRKDLDNMRFKPNSYVCCLDVKFENEENLIPVAYCEITEKAVMYILGFNE